MLPLGSQQKHSCAVEAKFSHPATEQHVTARRAPEHSAIKLRSRPIITEDVPRTQSPRGCGSGSCGSSRAVRTRGVIAAAAPQAFSRRRPLGPEGTPLGGRCRAPRARTPPGSAAQRSRPRRVSTTQSRQQRRFAATPGRTRRRSPPLDALSLCLP